MISTINSNTNRISGLASGFDTETLVKQLTEMSRKKIEAAEQQKQLLEWKQDYYRETTSKLLSFSNKYFGSTSGSILIGNSLRQLKALTSSSQYVSVVPGTKATSGSVFISDIVSIATSSKLESVKMTPAPSIAVDLAKTGDLAGKSIKITLDGVAKVLTFGAGDYSTAELVGNALQGLIDGSFGSNRVQVSAAGVNLTLNAASSTLSIGLSGIEGQEATGILGFTDGISNTLKTGLSLSELFPGALSGGNMSFRINGKDFTFTGDSSLNDLITTVNSANAGVTLSYSALTDKFTLTSKETGEGASIVYEDVSGSFLSSVFSGGTLASGTNAVLKVGLNGANNPEDLITLVRSSNTFEIEGSTYSLLGKASGIAAEEISVNITQDVDGMVTKIKEFVTDYNELLGFINTRLSEPLYRDFSPLTDVQKEALSESDQTAWTVKAKSGLLRNDIYLTSIAGDLRSSLYSSVSMLGDTGDSLKLILPDIGISTGSYTNNGKLTIDENKLRKSLSEDPEEVISLLAQKSSIGYSQYNTSINKKKRFDESGLLWRLNDIVQNNLSMIGKKGSLIELVGSPENNFIGRTTFSKKIDEAEQTISNLNDRYLEEQDRYWAKFTAMETALSKLNQQSSWISQQLSAQSQQ